MDFEWTDEQRSLRAAITSFALGLNEGFFEREARSELNRSGWSACASHGILSLPIPLELGGRGADPITTAGALEAFGYGCRDNGLTFGLNAQLWTVQMPLVEFGTPDQKSRFLPGLMSGEIIGANAISEPEAGSDAQGIQATAERRGDRYVLRGEKKFVTNGSVANIILAFAKTSVGMSAFIVESNLPGFRVTRRVDKMGLNTAQMAEISFDECEIPEENLLGKNGTGSSIFASALTWERSMILASAVGTMQRILEVCIEFARTRRQFGQAIGKFQLIASRIVDMKLRLETSRQMLYHTAWKRSCGRSVFMEAAMTKLHLSEAWVQTCIDAIQIHGGRGYLRENELERELRDAMASTIYSGTSEIQRMLIARFLGL